MGSEFSGSRFAQPSDMAILCSVLHRQAWNLLARLLAYSCTRPEWILLGCENGAITTALALSSHAENARPLEIYPLRGQLPPKSDSLRRLYQEAIQKARELGAGELYCTIPEDAVDAPIVANARFCRSRKVVRFESKDAVGPKASGYRSAPASAFLRTEVIALVEKASTGSADSQINLYRRHLGNAADAEMTVSMMESARHNPCWWRIALEPGGNPVGTIFPILAFGEPTVGFIGVLPEYRGKSIACFLLQQAWLMMKRHGCSILYAEADQQNRSIQRALIKTGFIRRWQKQEWKLELG